MLNVNTMKKVNGMNFINNCALFIFLLIDKNINDYQSLGGKYSTYYKRIYLATRLRF